MKVYILFQHIIDSLMVVDIYKNEKDAYNDLDKMPGKSGLHKSCFFIEEHEVIE